MPVGLFLPLLLVLPQPSASLTCLCQLTWPSSKLQLLCTFAVMQRTSSSSSS
jgi:hypothetical protein